MKVLSQFVMLLVLASSASAKPSYDDARQVTTAMHSFVSRTMIWNQQPLAQRLTELKRADKITADALAMFPEGSNLQACRRAADSMKSYVSKLNEIALALDGRRQLAPMDQLEPMYLGFQFGDHYRSCRDQVEALDTTQPRKAKQ